MDIKQVLLNISTKIGIFVLRSAGGAGIGIGLGFAFSYLVKHPGRIDTLALVESLLGIVITGLSIVAAFIVAFQWSSFDSRVQAFHAEVKEITKNIQEINRSAESNFTNYIGKFSEYTNLFKKIENDVDTRLEDAKKFTSILKDREKITEDLALVSNRLISVAKACEEYLKEIKREREILENRKNIDNNIPDETVIREQTTNEKGLAE